MATRGLRVLLTMPLLIALCVAGSIRLSAHDTIGPMIGGQPDQVVLTFLNAVNTGQSAVARGILDPQRSSLDVSVLAAHLAEQFGDPVTSTAKIVAHTPDHAVVWSETVTNLGHHYIINWTLQREGNRWIVHDFGNLQDMFPDIPGL